MGIRPGDFIFDALLGNWGAIGDKFKWFEIHHARIRAVWESDMEILSSTHYLAIEEL